MNAKEVSHPSLNCDPNIRLRRPCRQSVFAVFKELLLQFNSGTSNTRASKADIITCGGLTMKIYTNSVAFALI